MLRLVLLLFPCILLTGCAGSKHRVYDNDDGSHLRAALHVAAKAHGHTASVYSDENHVPHIGGTTESATYFAQGFTHAYYRLWQMESMSRIAEGSLSELMGPTYAKIDQVLRPYDIAGAAIRSHSKMMSEPTTRVALEAYVAGVNSWIEQKDVSFVPKEFEIFKKRPRKFETLDAARIITILSWSTSNPIDELQLSRTRADIDAALFEKLFPLKSRSAPPVNLKPDEVPIGFSFDSWIKTLPGTGSNAFVMSEVNSSHSFLANDFHMKFHLPAQFLPMQIASSEFNAIGSSLPGIPGILSGTNGKVAWGYVASLTDESDWFRLELRPGNSDEYRWNGEWKKFETDARLVKRSAAGVMVPALQSKSGILELAYKWSGEDGRNYLLPFLRRLKIERTEACGDKASIENSGPYVLTCVDTRHRTGVWLLGKVPQRPVHVDPRVVSVAGSDRDLSTFVSAEKMPRLFPAKDTVALANQSLFSRPTDPYLGWNFSPPDRSTRLEELLAKNKSPSFENAYRLQSDIVSAKTERIRKRLIAIGQKYIETNKSSACATEVVRRLKVWDGENLSNSSDPRLFNGWMFQIERQLWSNLIGNGEDHQWPSRWTTVDLINQELHPEIWDQKNSARIETKDDIVALGLENMCEYFRKQNKSVTSDKWSDISPSRFVSLPNGIFASANKFNADGSAETIFAQRGNHGTTYRSIIALGPSPRFWTVTAGGVSGDPESPRSFGWFSKWSAREVFESPYLSNDDILKRHLTAEKSQ